MERLFVDTSAWLAFVNRADHQHEEVAAVLRSNEGRLVTTSYIFDEAVTLASYRLGHRVALGLGDLLMEPGVVACLRITPQQEREAWELFRRRSDQRYSFTDCTSFVVMRGLGLTRAAALDDDFRREGFVVEP